MPLRYNQDNLSYCGITVLSFLLTTFIMLVMLAVKRLLSIQLLLKIEKRISSILHYDMLINVNQKHQY